jgi:glycosyltransferase involved in cell wall biosynthesis
MVIVFVTPEFFNEDNCLYPGGLANYIYKITHLLQMADCETIVIQPRFRNLDGPRELTLDSGVVIRFVPYRYFTLFKLIDIFTRRRFPSLITSLNIAFCLKNELNVLLSNKKVDIVQYSNYRLVHLAKIGNKVSSNTRFFLRLSSLHELWNNKLKLSKEDIVISYLELWGIKKFKKVFAPGNYILKYLSQKYRISNMSVLPTPFLHKDVEQTDFFYSRHISPEPLVISFLGTISKVKGSSLLFEIIDELMRITEINVTVKIAGKIGYDHNFSIMEKIEQLQIKFPNNFIYIQNLTKPEVEVFMRSTDIILIPSLHDNFPNVALEAISNNCFVICSASCSLEDLIEPGITGQIVPERNVLKWLDAIMAHDKNRLKPSYDKGKFTKYFPDNAVKELLNYYGD